MKCLDNEKWWGLPRGIRAALWNTLGNLKPEGADIWATLDESVDAGFDNGLRLASALYVMAAQSADDRERMREGIREFAERDFERNPEYRMLDAMAETIIRNMSDRMWTEATGKRTPMGKLGSFWNDPKDGGSGVNVDDLL
jgi:hypothetical protein